MSNYEEENIKPWNEEIFTWKQALAAAEEEEDFIVEGIISSATTLLYGESKTGKSYLVCALIAAMVTGGEFLGKPIEDRNWKVAVLGTDDRAEREYAKRISTVLPEGLEPPVSIFRLPGMKGMGRWKSLHQEVVSQGFTFVVVDSLTQAINGTINNDETIREFFEGVRLFVNSGIPVLVVAHSSEKTGINGKSDLPLGSSTITQSVRHRVYAYRQNGKVFLKFKGNHIAEEFRLTLAPGAGARFSVLEEKSLTILAEENAAKKAEREARKREQDQVKEKAKTTRSTATLDRNAQIVEYVIAECQGMKAATVAKKLSEKFGGAVSTYTTNLSRGQSFGRMLLVDESYQWSKSDS